MPEKHSKIVRIGLISRVDYGSDGFRRGLLEHAAGIFRDEDVDFVILAGGLVSAVAIRQRLQRLTKAIKGNAREIKAIERRLKDIDRELDWLKNQEKLKKKERDRKAELAKERKKIEGDLEPLFREAEHLQREQLALNPKQMADDLHELMPKFTNKDGKPVVLYIVTGPAYDDVDGERTANFLAENRGSKEVRVLPPGSARLPLWPGTKQKKELEILTPEAQVWMRGDYYSTPVERLIKDKLKQTAQPTAADLLVVGGFGSTITKPKGEIEIPYVAVPACHRIEKVRVSENQVGIRVMDLSQDEANPVVRTYNFKDLTSRERTFIVSPPDLSPEAVKIVDFLKTEGRAATGVIATGTGLSREVVQKTLETLRVKKGERRKSWPGVVYYEHAERWDFDVNHVQRNLRYVPYPGKRKRDRTVSAGCVHAGSPTVGYQYFLDKVSEVMIASESQQFVLAGDLVQGLKHNLAQRGETVGPISVTSQEAAVGWMIWRVTHDVFLHRFGKAYELLLKGSKNPSDDDVRKAIVASMPDVVWIAGNHDDWMKDVGWTPLAYMTLLLERLMTDAVEEVLLEKGIRLPRLSKLMHAKVIHPSRGRYKLPSGLKAAIMHPGMARAQTTSIRLQQMLGKARDCAVVFGANFHVAEQLEHWESGQGQRVCLELGTFNYWTGFEDGKLKTVDHGFARLDIESVEVEQDGKVESKIVFTETAFYSDDKADPEKIVKQNRKAYLRILEELDKLDIYY